MRTNFTEEQLKDPRISEVNRIIRSCVHCGLCTAVCSSYVILADERDSPRGRIYLMKEMFESAKKPSIEVRHHIDRCLSCLSCMTTCPSGVDYMHLVDHAREYIEERGFRPRLAKIVRMMLATSIPYPRRFWWMLNLGRVTRPFRKILQVFGLREFANMMEMVPSKIPTFHLLKKGEFFSRSSKKQGRVILLGGCAQQVLRPSINKSTIRFLNRCHIDVVIPSKSVCCGALVHHLGREKDTKYFIKQNIDAWIELIEQGSINAILINASGCGTMVKDYGYILQDDLEYAKKAQRVSALTRDISEFASSADIGSPMRWSSLKVAYHSACSLQHGQKIHDEPKKLLTKAGFTLVDIPDGHLCCGSAGTYNILQSEIATQLRSKKVANIKSQNPHVVAAGNIGCITQIAAGIDIPVVHTIELLDWAYGGPVPLGLEGLSHMVKDIPKSSRIAEDYLITN
ncbi:MAG: glycolate oxidase subunit GlcF [Hyphomicrobium sp.]